MRTVKVLDNVRLYCMQPRRADASTLCVGFRVSCRSDCQCDEVVHVNRHDVPEFPRRQGVFVLQDVDVAYQQPKCRRVPWYRTHYGILEVVHEGGKRGKRNM